MMKKIKSLLLLLMIVIVTFLVACSGQKQVNNKAEITQDTSSINSRKNMSPKETVEAMFNALTSLNIREFNEYIKYEDTVRNGIKFKNNVLFGDNIDGEGKDYMESIVSKLSYRIIHSEEKENTAKVKVQITNRDLSDIDKRLESEALNETSGDEDNLLISLIRSTNKTKNYDVTLLLEKSDSGWKIKMTKEFARAIYGGMPSFIDNLLPSSDS
ncbi:membrane-associated protein [Clostridium tetanomorphum DSM 665]|uniref:DUF4878 domain-containing protein n=1 Tax=Clostridium tetanomorphum TaxID=1553 RepID=A0A923E7J0_CLOTT|nr:DUF4878 domain-containing protein [Clostridium tetanomorphum]KAJ52401.1 membrane-associated protein [Clostridium tetanomorphum DSM 665]MBC2397920.1 DUF4878 domain-containing protein [Clostridium tetanomorphum]NRZ97158.1 hypothetical protein [Clostridium tetanomorphum]SQB93074.1 membrane-associated protein [Clostridium tetanomorphum]